MKRTFEVNGYDEMVCHLRECDEDRESVLYFASEDAHRETNHEEEQGKQ